MKQFISKVKNLSQKAAEIKAAMQQLPPKVAEVREAVAATTGQLQQLKSEIHYSVADLKADNESRLSEALQEINASSEVFAKAGFALSGVDLELSPVQRMLVHLARVEDVHASVIRSLASTNQHRRATHAILSALLQAQQIAETVDLGELAHDEVIVGVGPIPSVRLCWRAEEVHTAEGAHATPAVSVATPAPTFAAPQSAFAQSSFFEKRTAPVATATSVAATAPPIGEAAEPPAHSQPVPVSAATPSTAEAADPLARFKKMPTFVTHRK